MIIMQSNILSLLQYTTKRGFYSNKWQSLIYSQFHHYRSRRTFYHHNLSLNFTQLVLFMALLHREVKPQITASENPLKQLNSSWMMVVLVAVGNYNTNQQDNAHPAHHFPSHSYVLMSSLPVCQIFQIQRSTQ